MLIIELEWVRDGVSSSEYPALVALLETAMVDDETVLALMSLPWASTDVTKESLTAIASLGASAKADPVLFKEVMLPSWRGDGISSDEKEVLSALARLAAYDINLARTLATMPWLERDSYGDELNDLMWIFQIPRDWELLRTILGYSWVRDGVTLRERPVWEFLVEATSEDLKTAQRLTSLDWIADGLNRQEISLLVELNTLFNIDVELGRSLATAVWLDEEAGEAKYDLMRSLVLISYRDSGLTVDIVRSDWFSNLSEVESYSYDPLNDISLISSYDVELARDIVTRFSGGLSWLEIGLMAGLSSMVIDYVPALERMQQQKWFADGISDEEAAFIVTAPGILENAPSEFYDMLESRHVLSKSVELPLARSVNIWIVQKTPFAQDNVKMASAELALRSMEDVLQVRFPRSDVVVLLFIDESDADYEHHTSNLASPWPIATNTGYYATLPQSPTGEINVEVLFHELAHHYFAHPLFWFSEGAPEFLARYIYYGDVTGLTDEWQASVDTTTSPGCDDGAQNLYDLGIGGGFGKALPNSRCFYTMGEHFFSSLYFTLGKDAVTGAFRELLSPQYAPDFRVLSPKDVYLAFDRNILPEQRGSFRTVFNALHGGTLAGDYSDVPDDHGYDQSGSTDLEVGSVIQGTLDQPFDTDYFKFIADEEQPIVLMVDHKVTRSYQSSPLLFSDLYATLFSPGGDLPTLLNPFGGPLSGFHTIIEPPVSGEYYIAVDSGYGVTGSYSIQIAQLSDIDDHGNSPADATIIMAGDTITANIDNTSDVDYFRIRSKPWHNYEVEVQNQTIDHADVSVYGSEGLGEVETSDGWVSASKGAGLRWTNSDTGVNYLVVDGPSGNVGGYTIKVTESAPLVDDHGIDASTATGLSLRQVVNGTLDDSFDRDFFRFSVDAGAVYNIKFDHFTIFHQPVVLLAEDGVTELHWFEPSGGGEARSYGSFIPWAAPETGDVVLLFSSPDGDIGDYSVVVLPATVGGDDHADTPSMATALSIGQPVGGALNHVDDFDYFTFYAEDKIRYEIALDYDAANFVVAPPPARETLDDQSNSRPIERDADNELPDPRISLFGPDSINVEPYPWSKRARSTGRYTEWEAPRTGEYFVVIWSPQGDIGRYTVNVTITSR